MSTKSKRPIAAAAAAFITTATIIALGTTCLKQADEIKRYKIALDHSHYRQSMLQESLDDLISMPDYVAEEMPLYDIALSEELQEYTYMKAMDHGLQYELVLAVMWQESNFRPAAISSTNDYGIMQINKGNHTWLSEKLGIVDFLDAEQNIDAGTFILSRLFERHGDIHKVLMAYNMGETGAKRRWAKGIYTSNYSVSVVKKLDQLMNKNK